MSPFQARLFFNVQFAEWFVFRVFRRICEHCYRDRLSYGTHNVCADAVCTFFVACGCCFFKMQDVVAAVHINCRWKDARRAFRIVRSNCDCCGGIWDKGMRARCTCLRADHCRGLNWLRCELALLCQGRRCGYDAHREDGH
jgi:hypothetical protein